MTVPQSCAVLPKLEEERRRLAAHAFPPCRHPTHPQVSPASGQLAARSSAVVTVELSGASEKELIELLKLEVRPACTTRASAACLVIARAVVFACMPRSHHRRPGHSHRRIKGLARLPSLAGAGPGGKPGLRPHHPDWPAGRAVQDPGQRQAPTGGVGGGAPGIWQGYWQAHATRGRGCGLQMTANMRRRLHQTCCLPSPPNLQDGFAGAHFGALRVVDEAARHITLRNVGRYDVAFRFAIGSQVRVCKRQGGFLSRSCTAKLTPWVVYRANPPLPAHGSTTPFHTDPRPCHPWLTLRRLRAP